MIRRATDAHSGGRRAAAAAVEVPDLPRSGHAGASHSSCMHHWPDLLQRAFSEFARGVSTALTLAAANRPEGGSCPACPAIPPTACHRQSVCPSQTAWWFFALGLAAALGFYFGLRWRDGHEIKDSDNSSPATSARPGRRALAGGTWLGHGGAFSGRAGAATSDRD